ncbi:MAG: preprotein translocase subunit SecE [Patescibacteria group bacterium]
MSLFNYIKDTKGELKHVNWPTRQQTVNFTVTVIGMSIFIGVLLGLFDLFFTYLLKIFIFN